MGTKIGIVYAANSKILRRVIFPDSDRELTDPAHVAQGETMLVRDIEEFLNRPQGQMFTQWAEGIIEQATGKKPDNPRCVVVSDSTSLVTKVILADPELDTIGGCTLIKHMTAKPGWVLLSTNGLMDPTPVTPASTGIIMNALLAIEAVRKAGES